MTRSGGFAQRHPGFGVFVVGLGTLVVPFDSSVNVAFPHIVRGLDLAIPSIQWVVIAYTLAYAALTLVFGRVGDMLGYRRVFQLGNVIGAVAFLLCAAAPAFGWLLGARVLQGVGAALALSCGPALATSLYPEDQRTRILGLYTMGFGIGSVLGTVLAGELVQHFGWQAVFWFRAPIALLAFSLTWSLPRDTPARAHQRFDAPGAALLVLAVSFLLLTLNQLRTLDQSPWGFGTAGLITLLSIAGFIRRETTTDHPILSLRFFRDPDFSLVTAAHALVSLSGFSIMLLVPFYLDRLGGLSIPEGGLALASSPIGVMVSGPLGVWLLRRLTPRQSALLAAGTMAAAQIAISLEGDPAHILALAAAMFVQGCGMGLFQVTCFDISTATIPREDRGVAGSLVTMTRTVGVVTAATVLMLIFEMLREAGLSHGLTDGAAFLAGFQGAFRIAAILPILVVIAGLSRGWARGR
ncbi:MAG: MFS transporter [Acetobacteraceae bacterium]|nr:MFS transporter [Acetobacteraceae bacterium]